MKPLDTGTTYGMDRKVDELGRIVLPKEMRVVSDLDCGQTVEIISFGEQGIFLRRKTHKCAFCSTTDESELLADGNSTVCICKKCLQEFNQRVAADALPRPTLNAVIEG